jgi:hypothetical protein
VETEVDSLDWHAKGHDLKLALDQGNAIAHFNYGFCLDNGRGVPIDLEGAAHYFKLAVNQICGQLQPSRSETESRPLHSFARQMGTARIALRIRIRFLIRRRPIVCLNSSVISAKPESHGRWTRMGGG